MNEINEDSNNLCQDLSVNQCKSYHMSISAIVIASMLLVYGVYCIYDYFKLLSKNKIAQAGAQYFEVQGLLSGIISLFLATMIMLGAIQIDMF